jgi:2-(1,2-epoxy-1,2-dihydrophenyl)acetyl-CoA isomerase
MSDTVTLIREGAVAVLTLNRPESMNAMNAELLNTLVERGEAVANDAEVRCVVLTGNGRAFCAGGDIRAMAGRGPGDAPADEGLVDRSDVLRRQEEISRLLYEMPKPTIAAINGAAAGAGLSVALACDIRIASTAARFTTAFAKIGFSGDFGGTWTLQRLVGPAKARELYFLSEVLDAASALELGLVSRVVPAEELMAETMALATRLAAGPTAAFGRIKGNFAYGATHTLADTLTREAENMVASGKTEDHRSAAVAFLEKREPEFRGR